jgi:glucose-1-phosphate cytidylyltransferase
VVNTVILAGGEGTRLQEETAIRPKPMVEIGGRPILWHIMKTYRAAGFREFVIALGYKGDVAKRYFLDYRQMRSSITVDLSAGSTMVQDGQTEDWIVHLVDTGDRTQTGGRLKRLAEHVGSATFMMTYGDGVADINVADLVEFHRAHGRLATVTAVRPPARFGSLHLEGDQVTRFAEKPQVGEGWINGGYFVLEPQVLDYIDGDEIVFEKEPLERLAQQGQLVAFRHESFWQCMDTLRDLKHLEDLWASPNPPWKVWD